VGFFTPGHRPKLTGKLTGTNPLTEARPTAYAINLKISISGVAMTALQITTQLYIHVNPYSTMKANRFIVSTCDMSQSTPAYALLETREITIAFDEPDTFEIISKQVDSLRAQKERLAAESYRHQLLIDDQIQALLCIEHSTPSNVSDDTEIPF
jgi:hypothetical protein